jgi:hypothetical protein
VLLDGVQSKDEAGSKRADFRRRQPISPRSRAHATVLRIVSRGSV